MGWSRAFLGGVLAGGLLVVAVGCDTGSNIPLDGGTGGIGGIDGGTGGIGGEGGTGGIGGIGGEGGTGGTGGIGGTGGEGGTGGIGGEGGEGGTGGIGGEGGEGGTGGIGGEGGTGGTGGIGGEGGTGGIGGEGGEGGTGGIGGEGGTGGIGGEGGMGGAGGMGGMPACPGGADAPVAVTLQVDTIAAGVPSYEVPTTGLLVRPGPGSGNVFADETVGMGTMAIGNPRSIEPGTPNESLIFQIFRTDGLVLGDPEGATDVTLFVNGASATSFTLSAQDKDGTSLGSVVTTIGTRTIDVSALIPGEIHSLTIEATGGVVILTGIDYTHLCLGYTPAP